MCGTGGVRTVDPMMLTDRSWLRAAALALPLALVATACGDDDDASAAAVTGPNAAPASASVSIESPADGDAVSSPVTVEMAADGVTIEPAGEVHDGVGHFHVLVDVGCLEPGETIPADTDGYHHFGKAQTEAEIELEPGQHTLCLQVGDGEHTALDITDTVTITVEG